MPAGIGPYTWQWVLWLDQGLNVLCGGYSRETFSAHCWRCRDEWFWGHARPVVDALFFWQPDHCRTQFEREQMQAGLPAAYSLPR